MKKLFLLIPALLLAGILFSACQESINEPTPISENTRLFALGEDPDVYPLYAGQSILVGEVQVWNDEALTNLYVKFVITDPDWCLEETHVAVATSEELIPQKNGNPIPGQFPYKEEHNCVGEYEYEIPLPAGTLCEDLLVIATHAVVRLVEPCDYEADLPGFEDALPDQVTMKVQYPYGGGPAYFPVTTVTGGTILDGTYLGWCVDIGNTIGNNTNYTVDVYSSYESLPTGIVDKPENLDQVNWIVNQGFVGQASVCGGNYTYGDVQRAIWTVVDDNLSTSGLGSWAQCRVDEILAAAVADGEGFVPECGDVVAVIFAPVGANQVIIAQVIVGEVEVPCIPIYCDETAWGGTEPFPGSNWATYFYYEVTCEAPPPPEGCETETAWGGNSAGEGSAWWFYFDVSISSPQTIWAGQTINVGSVTYDNGQLVITLTDGWELQAVAEPVKVEGYGEGELPVVRPPAGHFTYKGTILEVTVDPYPYYAIHLDVQLCTTP